MLTHQISTVQVFATDHYKNFTMINGNRPLNQNKIERIIKEIEGGNDMLPYYPIQVRVVDDKLEILDGQHRYFICKKLKRQVNYIIVSESKSMADIARINTNVEKWTNQNFINCYINQDNDNYRQLQAFIDKYGINIGTCINLLQNGAPKVTGFVDQTVTDFQNGKFVVKYAKESYEIADDCFKFNASPVWRDRDFIIAICRIKAAGLITIKDLVSQFLKNPEALTKQVSSKKYLFNLEEIANTGKHKRIVIT